MADIRFRNSLYGDFTIYDSWPLWQKEMWLEVLGVPPKPAYVPTFEPVHTVRGLDGVPHELNVFNFATEESARWLMQNFGGDRMVKVPFSGAGGPEASDGQEWWIVWKDNFAQNAGWLLRYAALNPEATDGLVRSNIQAEIDFARLSKPMPILPTSGV